MVVEISKEVAKLQALKIYGRIIESCQATSAELLAGAERYAAEQRGQDPRYIKHPATWLNQMLPDSSSDITPCAMKEHPACRTTRIAYR